MSSLIDFYKQVIENLGLYVDEDGYIFNSEEDKIMITNDNKSMVLPTREHIKSVYTKNDEGEYVISKSLYNPLNEDVVKGDSPSFKKSKIFAERRLGHVFYLLGKALLILAENKNLQRKTSLEINKFLASINEANSQGTKSIVDNKTIENWDKIYKNSLKKPAGMFTIVVKKQGKYEGETYNRLAILGSNLYDELIAIEKEGTAYDVKLRHKEAVVFKLIFEYLLPDLDDNGTVNVGSNDDVSPAFITLMTMYIKLRTRFNKIVGQVKDVDKTIYNACHIDNLITIRELEDLDVYSSELATIPNETDLNRNLVSQNRQPVVDPGIPSDILNTNTVQRPISNQSRFPTQPVPIQQPEIEDDPVRRALGGVYQQPQVPRNQYMGINSVGMRQPMVQSQPYLPQPAPYQQYQQPYNQFQQQPYMGINSAGVGGYNVSNPGSYYQPSTIFPYGR